jgi:hypothetical protein
MSQAALQISTVSPLSGGALVAGANAALAAVASGQSGTAAPSLFSTPSTALREGETWLDTGVVPHVLRLYDGTAFRVTYLANPAPDAVFLYANFGVL